MSPPLESPTPVPSVAGFVTARSIAIVGASERSNWARQLNANLRAGGADVRVLPIHPKATPFFGQPSFTACTLAGEPVDLAFLLVPAEHILTALEDAAAAGARHAITLTSGFAEMGADGSALQNRLARRARELGVRLIGPNTLGFIDYNEGLYCWPVHMKVASGGPVAILSQSGAMGGYITKLAQQQGVGVGFLAATGNEADVGLHDLLAHLADDARIRVVAVFAESIRDTAAFSAAVRRCADQGKPVVVLKVGRSELTAHSAQAHTGALVGDDKVFDAACRELGMLRVDSLEELVETAGLLSRVGQLPRGGVAAVSVSGGAAEILGDECVREQVALPPFSAATTGKLRAEVVSAYGSVHNPLDVTGAAVTNAKLFHDAVSVVAADDDVALVACLLEVPSSPAGNPNAMEALAEIGRALKQSRSPGLIINVVGKPLGPEVQAFIAEHGVPHVASGIGMAVKAMRHAFAWSRWLAQRSAAHAAPPVAASRSNERPMGERATLDYLGRCGVPIPTTGLARTRDEAVRLAGAAGGPVVLKIASPDIAHKSDVGGVLLNLDGADAVADGFDRILAAVQQHVPQARIDGMLVMPMRSGGVEILAGVTRDPQWGWVLAVGLGGVLVEVLQDVSLRLLPVTPATVREMLSELRGARLLQGYRGTAPVNLDALAATVTAVAQAAQSLGDNLEALEVNPIYADATRAEAIDALAEWREQDTRSVA
jgi:acyl-CoA synthetase (NDP forming)